MNEIIIIFAAHQIKRGTRAPALGVGRHLGFIKNLVEISICCNGSKYSSSLKNLDNKYAKYKII